ncbi:aminotransferase, class V [Leptospira broomii serovar Hurstbridge str. 5399]|uniref:Aminotransferase, class V n=1 Tax=Leptospira broomii serovar Hurstbridge str. 5399 TaxID=1049789 RepID=T0GI01_9LEPT|nr:aminotransferase class V-fold PLP-dependent enzyme [Leptospira broomii]EQA46474.1 aminotransferase, class V [Leptospira broomii serovar Hurstbridge str. 5399]
MKTNATPDWVKIQALYPVNREMIWLNNCGTTPCNTETIRWVNEYLQGYASHGGLTEVRRYVTVKRVIRKILAELLGCDQGELSLIHNTNEGMNFISLGVQLQPGDQILLLENEYPSNIYPWEHWREKGVELAFVPMSETPEGFLENLKDSLTPETRLVSLSAVHWCTGMPFPLEEIGTLLAEKGIEFALDGAQGVGLLPIRPREMKISYMAFPAWKWLLGPLGLGVMYVAKEKLESLQFPFKGTGSVVNDEVYLPYREELKGTDRYEISTVNFIDWVYFQSTLEMLNEIGFHSSMARIYELADYLSDRLREAGWKLCSDHFPDFKTGIVVAEKPGISMEDTVNHLKKNGVMCALRLGKVRFSPHIYIAKEQLDRVVDLLAR